MILVSFSAKYVCEGKHAAWNELECDSRRRLTVCATFRCTKVLFQELVGLYLLTIPSAIGYVLAS